MPLGSGRTTRLSRRSLTRAAIFLTVFAAAPEATATVRGRVGAFDSLTWADQLKAHRAAADRASRERDDAALSEELSYTCNLSALTRYRTDDAACARAERLARGLGRKDLIAFALASRADAFAWLGRLDEARELGLMALRENPPPDTPDLAPRAHVLEMLGALAFETGALDEALRYVEESEIEAKRIGWTSHLGWIAVGRARYFSFVGDWDAAKREFERSESLATESGDLNLMSVAFWLEGLHEFRLNRLEASIARYDLCEELAFARGFLLIAASCVSEEADVLIRLGRLDDAWRHVDDAEKGLAAAGFPLTDALMVSRGDISLRRGDNARAVRFFDATPRQRPHIALDALRGKAQALSALGDGDGAIASLEAAARIIESTRGRVLASEMRSTYFESRALIYRRLFDAVLERHGDTAGNRLFAIAEALRARGLLDRLRAAGVQTSGETPIVDAEGIRARLDVGDVLIEYLESGDRLYAIVVDKGSPSARVVPLPSATGAAKLLERVAFFRALIESAGTAAEVSPAGRALYEDLLGLAIDARTSREPLRRIYLATDGPLGALPFEALVARDGSFLGASTALVRIPSASWLLERRAPAVAEARAAVFANPDPVGAPADGFRNVELLALPFADREARAIEASWPGTEILEGPRASETATVARLTGGYGALHFATHAVENESVPLRSFLRLSPGERGSADGDLRAEEIHQVRVSIPLVVLAACDSGHGRFRSGEGDLSLVRAFLQAGALTVVGAVLPVEDEGSARFFESFYRELGKGAAVEDALVNARRASIPTLRPRVWAAFTMSGAPGLRFAPPKPAARGSRAAAGIGIAIVLLLLATARRSRSRRPSTPDPSR